MSSSSTINFDLRGEFVALCDLLKATGVSQSGGEAKAHIASGKVQVDGQLELRKGAKIRAGQVVRSGGVVIRVGAASLRDRPSVPFNLNEQRKEQEDQQR